MTKTIKLLLVCMLCLYGATARAEPQMDKKQAGYQGMIGAAVHTRPVTPGSDRQLMEILPVFSLEYGYRSFRLFIGTPEGAGAELSDKRWGLFIKNAIDFGESRSHSERNKGRYPAGIGRINNPFLLYNDLGIDTGLHKVFVRSSYHPATVTWKGSQSADYHGLRAEAHIESSLFLRGRFFVQNDLFVSLMDTNYANTYFATKSDTDGTVDYKPSAELYRISAEQQFLFFVLPSIAIGCSVNESPLLNSAADSPVCKDPLQLSASLMAVYKF